jgi:hypothetical protein
MHGAFLLTPPVWLLEHVDTFLKTTYPDKYFGLSSAQHTRFTSSSPTICPKHPQARHKMTKESNLEDRLLVVTHQ